LTMQSIHNHSRLLNLETLMTRLMQCENKLRKMKMPCMHMVSIANGIQSHAAVERGVVRLEKLRSCKYCKPRMVPQRHCC
jgi:hypothetical protein